MTQRLTLLCVLVAIATLPTTTALGAIPGPVASWGFDEGSGTATADASGGGLTGTLSGPTWTTGNFGAGLSFDGVNDSVSVPDANALDLTSGMTLEAWVKPSALSSWQTVILKERPGDLAYALYGDNGTGRPATHIWTTSDLAATAGAGLTLNTWSHLAGSYDGATLRLYVNGTQVATRAASPPIKVSSNPLRFGGNTVWGEYFKGQIDEIRIYNRALSAGEIQSDMTVAVNGGTPPTPDTTAPAVSVTAPAAGAGVSGSAVTVSATASDNVGVSGVQFRLDGAALGAEDTTAPYTTTWNTTTASNGSHSLTAVARDAAANTTTSSTVTVTVDNTAPPPPPPPPPPPDPAVVGQWSGVLSFPLVPVHMTPMADGRIAMWDGFAAAPNSERLFDPQTLTFTGIPNSGRNLFCAVNVKLPDGRLLSAGGHSTGVLGTKELNLYNPATQQWTAGPEMSRSRWYPSSTGLADGRQFVISGDNIVPLPGQPVPLRNGSETLPEIYNPATNLWTPVPSAARRIPLYPFIFLLPDGRLFDAGPDLATRTLDLTTGEWSFVATSPIDGQSAVMYRPGKIVKSGSWADVDFAGETVHNKAAAIDMNEPSPQWRDAASMHRNRAYHTLTALPDGTVMASGGSSQSDGLDPAGAVLDSEIWDPVTDTWKLVARSQRPRLYHSSATLLQDGRVLLAGGGAIEGRTPDEKNGEIYSPPYMFKGARPAITSAPSTVNHGTNLSLDTPDATAIESVSLVRMSSITHNVDMDQRFQFLTFSRRAGGLDIDVPSNPNIAPPGVYQLFILNAQGVPSVAKVITIPVPGNDVTPPSAPTALSAIGEPGRALLSWTASTDNTAVTQYRVHRSTIAGFVPSSANRIATLGATTSYTDSSVVDGTTYSYRIVAADAAGNASSPSGEATAVIPSDTTPPSVTVTAPASGATVSGSAVAVSATASDDVGVSGVQFRLDGSALGAEDTTAPYATTWNTTTATNAGHTLTAVARDAATNTTTSTAVTVTVDNAVPPPPPPPPPPRGPVAAYGFEETSGTTAVDSSGMGNAGTLNGPTRTAAGKIGRALTFDGTNDWVTVNDAPSLDLTTGMTLEAWIHPTTSRGWRTAIMKENPPDSVYVLYAGQNANRPGAFVFVGNSGKGISGSAALPVNVWTHVAATYDGVSLRIFVDGTQVSTRAVTGSMPNSDDPLRIGGNAIWGEWFTGSLDEVRVYDTARTAAQIQADMTRAVP